MNICQFWVIDYILKQKTTEKFPIRMDDDEDLYGLVGGLEHNSDDDEDDHHNMVGQASGRDSFDGISHHHHQQQSSLDHLDTPQLGPGHDEDDFGSFASSTRRV